MGTVSFPSFTSDNKATGLREMEGGDHLASWPNLLQEALIGIFSKLDDFESLAAAAQVCRSWRCATEFRECWKAAHLAAHRSFLHQFIKDIAPREAEKLNSRSLQVLAHGGEDATTSICIDSIATDEMLQTITARFPSIESLSLQNCNGISATAFSELLHACKHLKFIDISFCNMTSTAKIIEEMGGCCPSLVGLNLSHLEITEEMAVGIGESMPKLKWLNLSGSLITNNGLYIILESCDQLQFLNVMWCPRLSPAKELLDMAKAIKEFKFDLSIVVDDKEDDDDYCLDFGM